jgi:hypothetical protein
LEGLLEKKRLVCFFAHLENFVAIWYILWPIGNFVLIFGVYFSVLFGILCQEKSGNPELDHVLKPIKLKQKNSFNTVLSCETTIEHVLTFDIPLRTA